MKLENQPDLNLISYCGFYCGACPKFAKGECSGCKGENTNCAVGYPKCNVKPCAVKNGFTTCADCNLVSSVNDCKTYNPLLIRIGEIITRTKRSKGIEMIKEKGAAGFAKFMADKNLVTIKRV